jgi:hypothetical protein
MDLEKAAMRISSLKTFNPKHEWSLLDRLQHQRFKKVHDREASIAFRKNVLESQKRTNYINEYDRLEGIMNSGLVGQKHPLEGKFKARQQQLKEMFKLSSDNSFKGSDKLKHSEIDRPHLIYR